MATLPPVASSSSSSGWDSQVPSQTSARRAQPAASVPDDWDDDDDDEDAGETSDSQTNQKIWDDANIKAPAAMPSLVISPTCSVAAPLLPGAFQPAMRILKRPTNAASSSSTSQTSSASTESLKEKEARYMAARQRIFGVNSGGDTDTSSTSLASSASDGKTERPAPHVSVVRQPKGPTESPSSDVPSRGFGRRQRTGAVPDS